MKTGEMICLNLSAVWGLKAYRLVKPGCVWGRERLRRTVPTLRNDAGGGVALSSTRTFRSGVASISSIKASA